MLKCIKIQQIYSEKWNSVDFGNHASFNYYAKVFEHQRNDPRKMWGTITSLVSGSINPQSIPDSFIIDGETVTDQKVIADKFNLYFTDIAAKMTQSHGPSDGSYKNYLTEPINNEFVFRHVSEDEVGKCIDSLKCKRTLDCYGLSTEIVKLCKSELVPVLTSIVNQCIDGSIFPEQLKLARVSAIHKKGAKNVFENYRPISILPVISKIFERVLHDQLSNYFMTNNLFYGSQYGFRQHHSTELAALEFIDTVINYLELRKPFISLYMDLSKAFDCLDHTILIEKLKHYGINAKPGIMLENDLKNRKQYLELKTVTKLEHQAQRQGQGQTNTDIVRSSIGSIDVGLPQGSILGPLLFIIFINDLCKCSTFFTTILYADDSIFSACINKENSNYNDTINSELKSVCSWLEANKLCLNVSKTKYMVFNRTRTDLELKIRIDDALL